MDSGNDNEPIQMNTTEGGLNGDGYGGPNISYEKFGEPEKPKEDDKVSISVVNGNGVVSGRKMVDGVWQKLAIFAIIITIGCIAGSVYSFIAQRDLNRKVAELSQTSSTAKGQLAGIFAALGASDATEAVERVTNIDILTGDDWRELNKLIGEKTIDYSKNSTNFVRRNGQYIVASFNLKDGNSSQRVVFYSDSATGEWKKAAFDASKDKHCEKSSDEELRAIRNVIVCDAKDEELEDK